MSVPRITVSVPCFGRPQRTLRSIQCIRDQNITGWEAFIMGDGCPNFKVLIETGYLEDIRVQEAERGNIIHYFNADEKGGGHEKAAAGAPADGPVVAGNPGADGGGH